MTTRTIQTAMGYDQLEPLRKVWVKHIGDDWPKGDAVLPKEKAIALLTILAEPTTRRKPEQAAIAADLLKQMQQNGQYVAPSQAASAKAPAKIAREKAAVREEHAPDPVKHTAPTRRNRTAPAPKQNAVSVWFQSITMLDVVYLATIATAIYGLWFNLLEMGLAFAVPYSLISFHALRMAKNPDSRRTAQAGIAAVVVLEILTFFIHLSMFNLRIVQAAKAQALPFEYSFYGTLEVPFYIACVLSGLFSAAGVYAVAVTFSLTMEKHRGKKEAELEVQRREQRYNELREALKESAGHWAILAGKSDHNPEFCDTLAARYFETLKQIEQ